MTRAFQSSVLRKHRARPASASGALRQRSPSDRTGIEAPAPSACAPAGADLFNEALYLAANPDVRAMVAAGEEPDGRTHWLRVGHAEERAGRRPSAPQDRFYPAQPQVPASLTRSVEAESYLYAYPDVRKIVGPDPEAACQHWAAYGHAEHRLPGPVAPFRTRSFDAGRMLTRPFGINVYGPFAAISGEGTAARGLVRALQAAGIPQELWNLEISRGAARVTPADRARGPVFRVNLLIANADQLLHVFRLFPERQFDHAYNIGAWAWELPSFRPDWHPFFGALDEVWTNSRFEVDAIAASSPVPVTQVPLPVLRPPCDPALGRAYFGIPEDAFVFLQPLDVSSSTARKNPLGGIAAFRAAFPPGESHGEKPGENPTGRPWLVIKLHSVRAEPSVLEDLSAAIAGMDNVQVIADKLDPISMGTLQSLCDCLLSPHRSEGFGLNIAEFLALGKPVIATNYSGNADFFDSDVGFPIDYRLTEVGRWTGPYNPHAVWAEPDPASIVAQLLAVMASPAEAARRSAAGAARIARGFNPEAVGGLIADRLRSIGLDAPEVPFLRWIGHSRDASLPSVRAGGAAALPYPRLPRLPILSVLAEVSGTTPEALRALIESVERQSYGFWEICLAMQPGARGLASELRGRTPRIKLRDLACTVTPEAAIDAAAETACGEYVLWRRDGGALAPGELMTVAQQVANRIIDALSVSGEPDRPPLLAVRKRVYLEAGGLANGGLTELLAHCAADRSADGGRADTQQTLPSPAAKAEWRVG